MDLLIPSFISIDPQGLEIAICGRSRRGYFLHRVLPHKTPTG
jgi:hypothetical protein